MKLGKLKEALQKMLAQFSEVSTDKGLVVWTSEGELPEVGEAVTGLDEEGNETVLEDGDYTLENGTVLVIKDGKVDEIKEKEEPKPEEEEPKEEENPEEEKMEDIIEPAEPTEPAEPQIIPEDEEPKEEEKTPEERIAALEALVVDILARLAVLEAKPNAETVEDEFKRVNKISYTGNRGMDNLIKKLNAGKN